MISEAPKDAPRVRKSGNVVVKKKKEKISGGRTYEERTANIQGTGTGPSFTNRLNGNYFLRTGASATVFDDGADDTLRGEWARDWFFASLHERDNGFTDRDVTLNELLVVV